MTSGWPTPSRYRLVLVRLSDPLTMVIGSFSGTSAIGACWLAAAESSSSVCEVPGRSASDRSGAVNGVQPSAGRTKLSSRALSLPLLTGVAAGSRAALAVLSWAVWPLAVSRYFVVTLSLGSWSTSWKLRVVGHGCPVCGDRPLAGIRSLPATMAWSAAA